MTAHDQALVDLHNKNRALGLRPIDRLDPHPETLPALDRVLCEISMIMNCKNLEKVDG